MPNVLTSLEIDLRWLAGIAGLATLAYAIFNTFLSQSRPAVIYTGAARKLLRTPYLILATILFITLGIVLWKPLPFQLPLLLKLFVSILGVIVFFSGLVLYIWGRRTLGESFNVSTGFGVRLTQAHRLVTNGPFAYVRHPMYIGVILACWGGLLLYRTWTMLFLSIIMLGLVFRARVEEQALAQVYGRQWELYQRHVPAWFPYLGDILRRSAKKHPHRR